MGENKLTSRNLVKLFLNTLLVGGLTSGVFGFIVRWKELESIFVAFDVLQILAVLIWFFVVGCLFSLVSQMGFFSYLTVHRFGLEMFRSLWNTVQVILILFVLFDIVYFRYKPFAGKGESLLPYIGTAAFILIVGLIVAIIKSKMTNKAAFIPALFFMVVVSIIEWVPALWVNDTSWSFIMIFPLLTCNAYQLLILHKLNESSQLQRQNIQRIQKMPSK